MDDVDVRIRGKHGDYTFFTTNQYFLAFSVNDFSMRMANGGWVKIGHEVI